jgi:alkaline phosphatase
MTRTRAACLAASIAALSIVAGNGRPSAAADRPATDWREAGRVAIEQARKLGGAGGKKAKNVILFLGDGMGVTTITAARIFDGQRRGYSGEENQLSFEKFPYVALSKTYTINSQVAESAATMTAIMTGVKTKEEVVGLDEHAVPGDFHTADASRVPTLLEQAAARGLATGIVTTTRVTHATPAACYAHVPHRDWEDDSQLPEDARAAGFPDIARQLVEFSSGDGVDVVFGGGRQQFTPHDVSDPEHPAITGARLDGRDLTAEWRARHPDGRYVTRRDEFLALDTKARGPVMGLFEPSHMNFEADRARDVGGEPSLSEMTARAIELLQRNPHGFFLMVEGGRIDHAHHLGNAYRALLETVELANAVRAAQKLVDPDDTLIVVTADHSHVLTMSGYPTRGNDILGKVYGNDAKGERSKEPLHDMLGLPFTTLSYANGPGYTGASPEQREGTKHHPHLPSAYRGIHRGRPDLNRIDTTDPDYLQEATVPARNETHGGEDVPIYAAGPAAWLVHGVQEESYVYYVMREALGWTEKERR